MNTIRGKDLDALNNGLYEDAPRERSTFVRLQVYKEMKRVGISQVLLVTLKAGKSII